MNELEKRLENTLTDERLTVIAAEILVIQQQVKATVLSAACEIGKRLQEVKYGLPHGKFLEWLENNVDCSERQAQQMMALYEEYGKNPNPRALENLSVSQAIALLSAPAEVRAELIDSGAAEDMSVRALKDEIARAKQEIEDRQTTIFQLESEAAAQKDLADKQAERAIDAEKKLQQAEKDLCEAEKTGRKAVAEKNDFTRRLDFANREKDKLTKEKADLEKRLSEAQAVEKVVEIEVTPPEIMEELERLRELEKKAPEADVVRARDVYKRIGEEINTLCVLLETMSEASAEKYRPAFAAGFRKMAEKLEGA